MLHQVKFQEILNLCELNNSMFIYRDEISAE